MRIVLILKGGERMHVEAKAQWLMDVIADPSADFVTVRAYASIGKERPEVVVARTLRTDAIVGLGPAEHAEDAVNWWMQRFAGEGANERRGGGAAPGNRRGQDAGGRVDASGTGTLGGSVAAAEGLEGAADQGWVSES